MNNIITKLKNCEKELEEINEELQTVPAGSLVKKGLFYYHSINGKEIGITNNDELIRMLCRKKYLIARKRQLDNNIPIISRYLNKLDTSTPKSIIRSLPNAYQGMPDSYFYHQSIEDWLSMPYPKNQYRTDEWDYFSNNGIPVRSKSEVLIANQLENYHIPYRYEAAITLGKQTKYPDFTIKNPFNGQLIIWEHFGAFNQQDYDKKMNNKMNLYLKHGYILFENLILTFEFDIRNDRRLKDLIENIILDVN